MMHSPASEDDSVQDDAVAEETVLSDVEKKQLLSSLEFDEIDARHQTIKAAHDKTCTWLLDKPEYVDWCDAKKLPEHRGFLWIKGKPGTGKSTLMKFCISKARERMKRTALIFFFFNARGHDLEKSTEGMYRSILFQLLRRFPKLLDVFDTLGLVSLHLERHQWTIEPLKALFKTAVQSLKGKGTSLVCFIDALDECPEPQIRDMASFFEQLGELAISARVKFHVCFSSRHYPHITVTKGLSLILEAQEGHQRDIEQYILSELKIEDKELAEHLHNESSSAQEVLATHIRQELQEKASGIFMWIVLVVRMLNEKIDKGLIDQLQQTVRQLPKDLHALFRDILQRDEKNKIGLRLCVQWVLFTRQPLIPRQLYCAIKSGLDERGPPEIDHTIEEKDVKKFILDSSKGLTEFTASDSLTVQFIHESVRDFFLKEGGSKEIWPELEEDFQGASHERLKQCCLTQMKHAWTDLQIDYGALPRVNRKANRRTSRAAEPSQVNPPKAGLLCTKSPETIHLRRTAETKFPLLKYAVQNVLFHADLAQKYGVRQDNFLHEFQLPEWVKQDNLLAERSAHQHTLEASILYILAEQNLANLIAIHPSKLNWLEIGSERCGPPILAALASKSYKAVDALLEAQGNLYPATSRLHGLWRNRSTTSKLRSNIRFFLGSSVSSYIAELGEDTILEYIISKDDYNIDQPDGSGQTLLLLAAKNGREAVGRLLLEKGANVEAADLNGMTPLLWAARRGDEAAIRLLLEKGANVEAAKSGGMTPLSWAACYGHKAATRLLLEKGANVEAADLNGMTPLLWAARRGDEAAIRLLLEKGANVEAAKSGGMTPLSWAACYGHKAATRLLLEKGANVEAANLNGTTPLLWAARRGDQAAIRLLLEKGANVEAADSDGKTPLSWAAYYGHKVAIRLLLEKSANVEAADSDGKTPLMWATEKRHTTIVELLTL
ncbi:nacht and ankyrin domain containing protein [Grosmannia clavigera kw1407]|uniref:Nacht and ankyrin domain containing protein n=1 Tax=Grosmannia clavigera (strain kw1407 / UAMH 11150) TaxID=655863 RepID=F0XQN7_GROCL|nr:nacht and ankyrin domain containing protein [Grosmannia clavigera kw1407]EFW99751.1 nacht and ankyrin domain containing protein [Grosmannia clavigera kw1407]